VSACGALAAVAADSDTSVPIVTSVGQCQFSRAARCLRAATRAVSSVRRVPGVPHQPLAAASIKALRLSAVAGPFASVHDLAMSKQCRSAQRLSPACAAIVVPHLRPNPAVNRTALGAASPASAAGYLVR
jgi:hypothetical protein